MLRRRNGQSKQAGFSLLEALVALVILSVSAKAILSAAEVHTKSVIGSSDRLVALWVAENRMVELRLGLAELPMTTQMAGRQWRVETRISETPDPELARVDLAVSSEGQPQAPLAFLTGYLPTAELNP